jgi:hypothetical protein
MNFNLGANVVAAVIYQMSMKGGKYKNKDHAYKWCVHINLFLCTPNARESPPRVRTLWGTLRDRNEFVQKFLERHRAQEQTACFLGETIAGRVPIVYFRSICITARGLVRYRSVGRIGRVRRWGDLLVSCRRRVVQVGSKSKSGLTRNSIPIASWVNRGCCRHDKQVQLHSHV